MNLTSGFSASLSGPDWLKDIRSRAAYNIERMSLPTTAEEMWRYSRVDEIDVESLIPAPPLSAVPAAVDQLRKAIGPTSAFVLTLNGVLSASEAGDGVSVRRAAEYERAQELDVDADSFVRMNAAFMADAIFVEIDPQKVVEHPIVVVHWFDGEDAAFFPRVMVRAGEASQGTVLEYSVSADHSSFVSSVTEIEVAQSANLRYCAMQALTSHVRHIGLQKSVVQRDATFDSAVFSLGGDYARTRTDSQLAGSGASSKLRAVYVGRESQMHDFRTLQDHRGPKTTSDLLFKGVVGDNARSVYSGLIRVEKGAAGTNAFQTNRNLVISEGAHADSVPNLEIEENDVRCSHASAVGPVDEEQLYYLESRGVPTDIAERLIISGFLNEIIDAIEHDAIRELVAQLVTEKLDQLSETVGA